MSVPSPSLHLRIIGPPEVVDSEGSQLEVRLVKPLSMLVYIAASGGRASRDELGELFWPDAKRPAHSVRQAIWQLRNAFGVELASTAGVAELPRGTVSLDVDGLDELRGAADAEALTRRLRGPVGDGLDFSFSPRLQDWFDDFRKVQTQRITDAVQRVAADLVVAGRSDEAREFVRRSALAGVSQVDVRQAVFGGLDLLPEVGATRVGPEIVIRRVEQLAVDSAQRLVLVRGSEAQVREAVEAGAVRRDVPARTVRFPVDPEADEADLIDDLIDALSAGGSGDDGPDPLDGSKPRRAQRNGSDDPERIVWALGDALDLAREQSPVVLLVDLETLPLRVLDLLARSLRKSLRGGLLMVAWSRALSDLQGPRAGALASSAASVARTDLEDQAAASPTRGGPSAPPRRRRTRARAAAALIILSFASVAISVLSWRAFGTSDDPAVEPPRPASDLVVCSDASGEPFLFYQSYAQDFVERISPFAVRSCPDEGLWVSSQRRLYLPARRASSPGRDPGLLWFEPGPNPRADWTFGEFVSLQGRSVARITSARLEDDVWMGVVLEEPEGTHTIALLDVLADSLVEVATGVPGRPVVRWQKDRGRLFWSSHDAEGHSLWGLDWPSGQPRRMVSSQGPLRLVGTARGRLLVEWRRESARTGAMELAWVDPGQPPEFEPLTVNDYDDEGADLAPDGQRICWTSHESVSGLSRVRVYDAGLRRTEVLQSEGSLSNCRFSPDGRDVFVRQQQGAEVTTWFAAGGRPPLHPIRELPGDLYVVALLDPGEFVSSESPAAAAPPGGP